MRNQGNYNPDQAASRWSAGNARAAAYDAKREADKALGHGRGTSTASHHGNSGNPDQPRDYHGRFSGK